MPVVATASIPFIPRLMDGYPIGRCVPVGDIEQFAKAMIEVLDSRSESGESKVNLLQRNMEPLFKLFE